MLFKNKSQQSSAKTITSIMCDGIIEEIEASDRIIIISSQVRTQIHLCIYINVYVYFLHRFISRRCVQLFANVHESRLRKYTHPQSLVSSVGRALDF